MTQRERPSVGPERTAQLLEFRLGAPGRGPLHLVLRAELVPQVAAQDLAHEARGAEGD